MPKKPVTVRRTLQQIKHCVEEALAAHEANEDSEHIVADLQQARELIDIVMPHVQEGGRFVVG